MIVLVATGAAAIVVVAVVIVCSFIFVNVVAVAVLFLLLLAPSGSIARTFYLSSCLLLHFSHVLFFVRVPCFLFFQKYCIFHCSSFSQHTSCFYCLSQGYICSSQMCCVFHMIIASFLPALCLAIVFAFLFLMTSQIISTDFTNLVEAERH